MERCAGVAGFRVGLLLGLIAVSATAPPKPDLLGAWVVQANWGDASIGAPLELKASGEAIEGVFGPLDIPGFFPLQ